MNVWSRLCRSAGLLVALGSLVVALGASAVVAAPAASAASNNCAAVTGWAVTVNSTYFFLDQGGGWISSSTEDASGQFGTVSLSVTATSFHAVNPYLPRYNGYTATFNGTVSGNCLVRGTWTSVKGANHGVFTAYPLNLAPAKPDISGDVTGSDGKPLAGIDIDVRNASGAVVTSAATDGTGHYQTTTLDPGAYSVAPATDPDLYTPSVVRVTLSNAPATANFSLAACSAPAVRGARSLSSANEMPLIHAASSAAGGCLNVVITVQRSVTAGIGWRREPLPAVPEFIAPVSSTIGIGSGGATTPEHCLQGCLNVEVKVTNKRTGKLVPSAKVTLSVTPFSANAIAPYPTGFASGDGHLCDGNEASSCGTQEITVTTGAVPHFGLGVAQFLYWAPGAITKQSVKFSATAIASCDSATFCSSASRGELQGTAAPKLVTIAPNFIYTSALVFFNRQQIQLLEDWAADQDNFRAAINEDTVKAQGWKVVISAAVSQLVDVAVEPGIAAACPPCAAAILAADAGHQVYDATNELQDLGTEVGLQQGISALFLAPLQLIPAGLGDVNADELDPSFLSAISGKDGLMQQFGLALRKEEEHSRLNRNDEMQLQLIDVSYCTPGGICGPGVEHTPGIQPFLRFDFRAYNSLSSQPIRLKFLGSPWFNRVFVLPYDPWFFSVFQFKGKGPLAPEAAGQTPGQTP
jgi:hypothetical protein